MLNIFISSQWVQEIWKTNGLHREKTYLRGFRQSEFQTSLLSYRDQLENWNFTVPKLHMQLSKKWITMALIRLCGCSGWSEPVLFANPRRQVQIIYMWHLTSRYDLDLLSGCLKCSLHITSIWWTTSWNIYIIWQVWPTQTLFMWLWPWSKQGVWNICFILYI